MSTEFKGIGVRGLIVEGKKTFASIPGLIQLNEMDFEVTTISNSGNLDIVRVGDRSGFGNTIEGDSSPRRSQLVNFSGAFKSMRQSSTGRWSKNITKSNWTNVIRQNPFGIFALYARNSTGSSEYMLKHGGNETNKFWFIVSNTGAVQHIFRNASNSETSWGTSASQFPLDGSAHAVDLVSYGSSEATKMEIFIDTISKATRTTSNISGTETANREMRLLEQATVGAQQDLIMIAVYDWTGFTKSQIDVFRADINAVREEKYGTIF